MPPKVAALSVTTASPLSALTISGADLIQSGATVSVRFTPAGGGPAVTVPVSAPSATGLQLAVPPLVALASGVAYSGPVDVQVIKVSGDTVYTSNVIKGLEIAPLPSVRPGEAAGIRPLRCSMPRWRS
jgi:hypothetical protein